MRAQSGGLALTLHVPADFKWEDTGSFSGMPDLTSATSGKTVEWDVNVALQEADGSERPIRPWVTEYPDRTFSTGPIPAPDRMAVTLSLLAPDPHTARIEAAGFRPVELPVMIAASTISRHEIWLLPE
ncbi:MAG: hypothetical protein AB1486_08055 [Planctomycetota bacterium]